MCRNRCGYVCLRSEPRLRIRDIGCQLTNWSDSLVPAEDRSRIGEREILRHHFRLFHPHVQLGQQNFASVDFDRLTEFRKRYEHRFQRWRRWRRIFVGHRKNQTERTTDNLERTTNFVCVLQSTNFLFK